MIYFCIGTQCNIGRVAKLASIAIHRGCGTGIGLAGCYCQGITKETSLLRVHFSRFIIIWTCFLQIFFLIFWYFSFQLFRCRFLHFFFILFQCKHMLGIYVSIVRIIIIFLDKNQVSSMISFLLTIIDLSFVILLFQKFEILKIIYSVEKIWQAITEIVITLYHINRIWNGMTASSNDPRNGYVYVT